MLAQNSGDSTSTKSLIKRQYNIVINVKLIEIEMIKEVVESKGRQGQIVSKMLVKRPKQVKDRQSDSLKMVPKI